MTAQPNKARRRRELTVICVLTFVLGVVNGSQFPIDAPYRYILGGLLMLGIGIPVWFVVRDKIC